jgi:hypothetical protein
MEIGVPSSEKKPFATVTVGSVTISIIAAPVTLRTGSKPAAADSNSAASVPEFKTYQSFQVAHYEGKRRILQRRNTPEKAKALAREIAGRLHRDGSRAQYFTEKDRRIYTLAQVKSQSLGLEVDEVSPVSFVSGIILFRAINSCLRSSLTTPLSHKIRAGIFNEKGL